MKALLNAMATVRRRRAESFNADGVAAWSQQPRHLADCITGFGTSLTAEAQPTLGVLHFTSAHRRGECKAVGVLCVVDRMERSMARALLFSQSRQR